MFLSRIFGKHEVDLELASSRAIAFAPSRQHTLDMVRESVDPPTTALLAVDGERFRIGTGDDSVELVLDPLLGTIRTRASTGVYLTETSGGASLALVEGEARLQVPEASSPADISHIVIGDDGVITSTARHGIRFVTSGSFEVSLDSSSIIEVVQGKITLNADVDVKGALNSVNVTEKNLEIVDHTITLSAAGTDETLIVDGENNDASGIVVEGFPEGVDRTSATMQEKYEKSIKWHHNGGGIDDMLSKDATSSEAFWDVRGGSLRLSAHKEDGTMVGFALRINQKGSLEVVQLRGESGSDTVKDICVARFGTTQV